MSTRLFSLIALFPLYVSCDFEPRDVTFYVWEEEEVDNGRFLNVNRSDSVVIDAENMPAPECRYKANPRNIAQRRREDLTLASDSVWAYASRIWPCFPVRVHRASGRVDTLYCFDRKSAVFDIGYISAFEKRKGWLVIESKVPGKILGHECLACDDYNALDTFSLSMTYYTFAGQERVFASEEVDYWIASLRSYDIFGPLTRQELKKQMQKLHIPLPMKLDGYYDRYVYLLGRVDTTPTPEAFYWPHHRNRVGTTIE